MSREGLPKTRQTPVPPISPEESSPSPAAVREQLERVIKSSFFRKSQRYTAFLRYSVEVVLAGHEGSLKERTIGIEVFGRPADYDTAVDHVVRSAACEIRKRLAQYYREPAAAGEILIDLHPGSYVPQFMFSQREHNDPVAVAGVSLSRKWRRTIPAIALLGVLAAIAVFVSYGAMKRSPLDLFWSPILSSRERVTLCVGNPLSGSESSESEGALRASDMHFARSNRVSFASATTLAKLTGLLQSRGKQYQVMLRSGTKFSDLQQGPSVLIGGFNNDWTMRLAAELRFRFERQPEGRRQIRDRQNPARNDWSVDFSLPKNQITRDYAIVSRVQDPHTEQTTVIAAGIAHWGTLAAGDFITDPEQLRKLQASAPRGWEHMNIQVVLSTDVIDGVSGPPKIVATQFW